MTRQATPDLLAQPAPAPAYDLAAALPRLRRCAPVASRKASAIAGRRVVVEFVEVGEVQP